MRMVLSGVVTTCVTPPADNPERTNPERTFHILQPHPAQTGDAMKTALHRIADEVLRTFEVHKRVAERQYLRNRPWLEETLHWSRDGELHGHIAPAPTSRSSSVTSDGWCPGLTPESRWLDR
jgi:hypothetical protein